MYDLREYEVFLCVFVLKQSETDHFVALFTCGLTCTEHSSWSWNSV